VQKHPVYSPLLAPVWQAIAGGRIAVATSQLSLMECLVGPLQWNDASLRADFERFFQMPALHVAPIDKAVLRQAAQLRAAIKSLRTPERVFAFRRPCS
jgi:hypothetical protein